MKLRNKKTGLIADAQEIELVDKYVCLKIFSAGDYDRKRYNSLAEFNEEWEEYEEPKKYWFIDAFGNIVQNEITKHYGDEYTDMTDLYESQKQIGNRFETEEETELALEKLKAWERLKDKGFRFDGEEIFSEGLIEIDGFLPALKESDTKERLKMLDDLSLLFSGGEE